MNTSGSTKGGSADPEICAHWDWCPYCRNGLDTGLECDQCGADLMPVQKALEELQRLRLAPEPAPATNTEVLARECDRYAAHLTSRNAMLDAADLFARCAIALRQPSEPAADVAALNRELCDKEGHVLGVIARPCLRCHAWFDPQYGKNMNLADRHDLSLFALTVLTNLTGATPATHPDTFKVAQQYADAWRARQPETKMAPATEPVAFLTNEQCDEVINQLEDFEWSGLTRENVRTWAQVIADVSTQQPPTKGAVAKHVCDDGFIFNPVTNGWNCCPVCSAENGGGK